MRTTSAKKGSDVLITAVLTCALGMVFGYADSDLSWHTVDCGGGTCGGGNFELSGTTGQGDAGPMMVGGAFALTGGFWSAFSADSGFAVGDMNCDGSVDLFDIDPFVIALTSASELPPFESYRVLFPDCDPTLADADGSGAVNLFDIDAFVIILTAG